MSIDGARALSRRNLTEGLCRRGPHAAVLVAEERQQLVDHGARALAGRNLTEGLRRRAPHGALWSPRSGSSLSITAPARSPVAI